MSITKHWGLGLAGALLFAAGVASGQVVSLDRYAEAKVSIEKAQAFLNNIFPVNTAEKRQHDKAQAALANAQSYISCAMLRYENKKAVCE